MQNWATSSSRQSSGASFTVSCHLIPNNNTVLWERFSRTLPFKKIYCDNLLVIGFKIFSKKVYFAICAYAIYKLMYYNIQFLLNKYCIGWAVQIRKKKPLKFWSRSERCLKQAHLSLQIRSDDVSLYYYSSYTIVALRVLFKVDSKQLGVFSSLFLRIVNVNSWEPLVFHVSAVCMIHAMLGAISWSVCSFLLLHNIFRRLLLSLGFGPI